MGGRTKRAATAKETLEILSRGSYWCPAGKAVPIHHELRKAVGGTRLYRPYELAELAAAVPAVRDRSVIRVVNTTTLAAARSLHDAYGPDRVGLLNFASARNVGGGVRSGSQAQEESLARASGLYACLSRMTEYYEANREQSSALYTDHMIYSPRVPVFRDDDDGLLDEPWSVAMITAPAPNAGAVRHNEPENAGRIREVMRQRIASVLALAAHHAHDVLVLGAWGCGVFANDPDEVAELFAEQLLEGGPYARAFSEVVFAVFDRRGDIIGPFLARFGSQRRDG